ncbi:hypothetical protein F4861DRAFT_335201 [Xylaria intraflava]|nr:hypothetical protein F4861DRAFT_335201 [Xylaria intraflava]
MPESNDRENATQSTMDWAKEKYTEQYEAWMPWIEDTFLKYFTKDNRTSYAARDQLDKTKITNIPEADKIQDKANDLAASQVGQGGLLEPVGDLTSDSMKRAEHDNKPRNKGAKKNSSSGGGGGGGGGIVPGVPGVGL